MKHKIEVSTKFGVGDVVYFDTKHSNKVNKDKKDSRSVVSVGKVKIGKIYITADEKVDILTIGGFKQTPSGDTLYPKLNNFKVFYGISGMTQILPESVFSREADTFLNIEDHTQQ